MQCTVIMLINYSIFFSKIEYAISIASCTTKHCSADVIASNATAVTITYE